jgi:hypothetical protein
MPTPSIEEVEDIPPEKRSLGETLLLGVHNLWTTVNELRTSNRAHEKRQVEHDKILAHLLGEIERLSQEIIGLRHDVRGLRVKAGKANAAKVRLEADLVTAQETLGKARRVLLH